MGSRGFMVFANCSDAALIVNNAKCVDGTTGPCVQAEANFERNLRAVQTIEIVHAEIGVSLSLTKTTPNLTFCENSNQACRKRGTVKSIVYRVQNLTFSDAPQLS